MPYDYEDIGKEPPMLPGFSTYMFYSPFTGMVHFVQATNLQVAESLMTAFYRVYQLIARSDENY